MPVKIIDLSQVNAEGFVFVKLSNYCNIRMTRACWIDLNWKVGQTIGKE
jgi:hypothetical protein